ncbi:MAG: transcriptional repressor [Brotaphodocola sp.]
MKALKYSRQRESIKAYLVTHHDHPTADAVYAAIREEFPNISLGTVYRNLNLLVELGEVKKLSCGDGKDHFDADLSPHYHFICQHCGAVIDLPIQPLHGVIEQAQQAFDGQISAHVTYFYGTCPDCLAQENH